ncbi:hypothetical protein ABKV19_023826 [Rosa sericea]
MAFFAYPCDDVPASKEEFSLFHTIDCKLFTRLVFGLGRDPAESAQVMALWMWLEHNGKEFNLVYKTLMTLPNTLLNAMAEESILALKCIQSDDFPRPNLDITTDIPLLQAISKSGVTLEFFHDNRIGIMRGVSALFKDICLKAFQDLLLHPHQERRADANVYNPTMGAIAPQVWNPAISGASLQNLRGGFDPYDLSVQREILNKEMEEVLSRLTLNDDEDDGRGEDQEVEPHERTIFLTFSKGYPISENEIREFITKKFGDVIEAIYMQEVLSQQPLYARLVVRSASSIPVVLEGQNKAKFTIKGKHVWARKYVHKTQTTPP